MVATLSIIAALIMATVLFHYEALRVLSIISALRSGEHHTKMLVIIFGVIAIHFAEAAFYALGFWFGVVVIGIGSFSGAHVEGFWDYMYFSVTSYTTAGYGDIVPVGDLRILAGMESMNGVLLLGWSGSFTYLAMQRYWDNQDDTLRLTLRAWIIRFREFRRSLRHPGKKG